MHITDDLDREVKGYTPVLDSTVILDAPYIDFSVTDFFGSDEEELELPETKVIDTLFYKGQKILRVDEIAEIEIRFYTSETPNEKYRVGQKHMKGRVKSLSKINDKDVQDGYAMVFDCSTKYEGKIKSVAVDRSYVETTKTKCIAIIYFDDRGIKTGELVIKVDDWFNNNTYINAAIIVDTKEEYLFKDGDLVDFSYYTKQKDKDGDKIVKNTAIGKIINKEEMVRKYDEIDDNGISRERTHYYYAITFDVSEEYTFHHLTVSSNVIYHMEIHEDENVDPDP